MNIPNAISFCRLFSVPVVVWLVLSDRMLAAFWISLAAAMSDAVDGIIAKHFHSETVLGGFLDPIADKVLLVCLYISLAHAGHVDMWLVILVVFRDAVIVGGALMFHTMTHSLTMAPLMISKINTVAQLMLAVAILGDEAYHLIGLPIRDAFAYVVGATTLASGAAYVFSWTRKAQELEFQPLPSETDDKQETP